MSRKRICIVTPDLVGPATNGGIGTHCHALARHLASFERFEVSVLFTNACEREDEAHWREHFAGQGIAFEGKSVLPEPSYSVQEGTWFHNRSLAIYRHLASRQYDVIHFQDWLAGGFASIQAKRTGRAFDRTLLAVTMHSPTQWHHQGMERWSPNPETDTRLTWCERYACRHADVLISVTDYMLDWAGRNYWQLAAERRHLPCCYRPEQELAANTRAQVDPSNLVFFGRLETRKGLEVFCQAVRRLREADPGWVRKVSFLGKTAEVRGVPSLEYIGQAFADAPEIEVEIATELDTYQALGAIKVSGGVVVLPSLVDNSPYTVIECISYGLPFIAAGTGGIPELAAPEVLFVPTAEALTERLAGLRNMDWAGLSHPYSNERAEALWLGFHEEAPTAALRPPPAVKPRVSVCMPHFNHGRYLPEALASLAAQDYPDFEVVVFDDGSTDADSVKVFEEMRATYPDWTFVSGARQGVRAVRNEAARLASGELVTFFDSDNVAEPHMVSSLVAGLLASGGDCVACHYVAYADGPDIGQAAKPLYGFLPLGPCLEYGFLFNVFGDTCCIMRRQDFLDLGGFLPAPSSFGYEDWEFLASLCLAGRELEVVPEPLYRYRYREDSFNNTCQRYDSWRQVVDRYYAFAPFVGFLVSELAIPLHERHKGERETRWRLEHTQRHAAWLEKQVAWNKEQLSWNQEQLAGKEKQLAWHKEELVRTASWFKERLRAIEESRTYRLAGLFRDAAHSPKAALLLPARLVWLALPEKLKKRLRPLLGRK